MKITPQFYKREAKNMVPGNVAFRTVSADPNTVRMFVRVDDDSDHPSRVCVEMSRDEAILMFHAMIVEFPFLGDYETLKERV